MCVSMSAGSHPYFDKLAARSTSPKRAADAPAWILGVEGQQQTCYNEC